MRLVYLDEAGIGSPDTERFVVVAGVLVDPDKQWRIIEAHLSELARTYVLPQDRDGFVFHAMDIHHGARRMDRTRYSRTLRVELLRKLCLIPTLFDLPVVAAYVERDEYRAHYPELSEGDRTANAQAIAAVSCTCAVEKALRQVGSSNEVAVLVFENNESTRRAIRECHNILKTPASLADATALGWALQPVLPFTKIVDTTHFVAKDEAPILQVSDAIAFAISRQLNGRDAEGYATPIGENLIMRLRAFTPGSR